ncbi:hypothetical protein [Pseudomonas sp. GCEP-101]|uniref:hypothetical protein n=1 Tax=Pseudomonas sp. GCEP-101 TaxID=2974552 RepID=UPI00223B54B3|nr:hypothetical protein [Pseudomonas sp. GCEP-101]
MSDIPQDNPFQTPAAILEDSAVGSTTEPLYRLIAVGIATLIGTPIAGAWVISRNLERLRLEANSSKAWALGIGLFVAVTAANFFITSELLFILLVVAQVVGMYAYARLTIGKELERHLIDGGQFEATWLAAGAGLVFRVTIVGAMLVIGFVLSLVRF